MNIIRLWIVYFVIGTIADYFPLVVSEAVVGAEDQEEDVVDETTVVVEGEGASGASETGIMRMGGEGGYWTERDLGSGTRRTMSRRNRREKAGERGNPDGETAMKPMKKMQMESSTSPHLLMNNKFLPNLIISKMRPQKVLNLSTFLQRHLEI